MTLSAASAAGPAPSAVQSPEGDKSATTESYLSPSGLVLLRSLVSERS